MCICIYAYIYIYIYVCVLTPMPLCIVEFSGWLNPQNVPEIAKTVAATNARVDEALKPFEAKHILDAQTLRVDRKTYESELDACLR